jgi:phosphopantothenoylcysteine decarboxylase/phosphopantothenate--cysteine ligase
VQTSDYETFDELKRAVQHLLSTQHFDSVIHAAAVSDYKVSEVTASGATNHISLEQKIPSSSDVLHMKLVRNPKILDSLREYSRNKEIKIVAFKLMVKTTAEELRLTVNDLFDVSCADLIVHNDLSEVQDEVSGSPHRFRIFKKDRDDATAVAGKTALAKALGELL